MSLVRFLIILAVGTLISWASWLLVLMNLDPQTGGLVALVLFYASFFLALLGTITIVGFFLRYWLEKEAIVFRQVSVALRQATWLTAAATIALLLQSRRLLNIWSGLCLIILVLVIEAFFLVGQTDRGRQQLSTP